VYLSLKKFTKSMNEIKAIILCNNPIAIPGIKEFLFFGKVAAIAIPKRNKEMQHVLESMLKEVNIPLLLLHKKEYVTQLEEAIIQHKPNVVLMMTFPFTIPPHLLSKPKNGFINFHYGLLPQCQGPQPILWHMLNNDTEAGVTVHKVDEGIDTGDIIMQEKIAIEENDTYGILQSKLAFLGAKQAASLFKILSYGNIIPATKQDLSKAKYYEMPTANNLSINWQEMDATRIVRLVNACNPWNKAAGTSINNWGMGITEAEIVGDCLDKEKIAGYILVCNKDDGLVVKTMDNKKLRINIIYTNEGFFSGNKMTAFGIKHGDIFK
jgi:methionyl-tRNA formyltransferase